MRHLTLGIFMADENGEIISKRQLESNWTVNDEQDLMDHHSLYFYEEVSKILVENLKLSLNSEMVEDMLKEIKEKLEK